MTAENVLGADVPGIMNIEDAKSELQSEREAYWAHLTDPKLKALKRRAQNRINKYVSRWKTFFYLDTAEDYHILACEIQDMREGRAKRREGRPRTSEDRSKRRTSQRLADKRRKPDADNLEEDILYNSGIDFGFDQLDTALPSEDINISTETITSHSSVASSGDEFAHSISNEIDNTPDSISNNLFGFCNSQTLSQYSNISSLADETWCHSDDMSDPSFMSGILQSGTNVAGDRWIGSLQQDICDGNSMNFEWQSDPPSFNASHDASGIKEHWNGSNIFASESHGPAIQPVMHHPMKSASGGIDSSVGLPFLPPVTARMQQPKRFDEAQLYMLMTELKSQLQEGRRDTIQMRPAQGRRPLAERDDLAPLIAQCLTTLREPATCMSGPENKEAGARQEDSGSGKRYGAELETRVAFLWNALTVESCRIPSSVT